MDDGSAVLYLINRYMYASLWGMNSVNRNAYYSISDSLIPLDPLQSLLKLKKNRDTLSQLVPCTYIFHILG